MPMLVTIAAATAATAGIILAGRPATPCEAEDGSDMLYTSSYSVCTWNEPTKASSTNYIAYWVQIDRASETRKGAYLTYIESDHKGHPDFNKVPERVWVEK